METSIFNAYKSKDIEDGPPSYLHTQYLRADHRARCEQNPTYAESLASLCAFAKQVEGIRIHIAAQELGATSELDRRSLTKVKSIEEMEEDKQQCRELEQKLLKWDDELASLAEAILAKPKFGVEDKVELIDGKWYWQLPPGTFALPRCTEVDLDYAFREDESKTEAEPLMKKLTRKIPQLWRKSSDESKLVKRAKSVDGVF